MKIEISNISVLNENSLHEIIGNAGYNGCINRNSYTTANLDLGTSEHRMSCGIEEHEIYKMIFDLIECGFIINKMQGA